MHMIKFAKCRNFSCYFTNDFTTEVLPATRAPARNICDGVTFHSIYSWLHA